jgi:hypothetical protein
VDLSALPGGDLVTEGLADLAAGRRTPPTWLVQIGAQNLRRAGVDVPVSTGVSSSGFPEDELYEMLRQRDPRSAHSEYNALLRRLVSFERALACARE